MKSKLQYLKLIFPVLLLIAAVRGQAQKKFTVTNNKENNYCNGTCTLLDIPELNNNPEAIVFATALLENEINLNPHPIGAYYIKNQWSIFNLNQQAIPVNAKFNVEYFVRSDQNHFQYTIANEDVQNDGTAFINHPVLNKNPKAQFRLFTSWNPEGKGGLANMDSVTTQYNATEGKWVLRNSNGKYLFARATYNIYVTASGNVNPVINNAVQIKELFVTPANNSVFGAVIGMWMTVWADGIKLPGDNQITSHLDQMEIIGLEMGAEKLFPEKNSGKNSYSLLTIRIRSGYPGTVPLLHAFINKQDMAFTISAFSPVATTGQEALNYTIKLTSAYILNYKQVFGGDNLQSIINTNLKFLPYDEIKIKFKKIEYINSAGAIAVDII